MVSDAHWQKDDKDQIIKDKMANLKWMMMLLLKQPRESGMDNATRFDKEGVGKGDVGVKVLKTKIKEK